MTHRIEILKEKRVMGMRRTMSFAHFTVGELWQAFMPRRKEIPHCVTRELISMAIYKPDHFENFNPTREFDRWAAVEVTDVASVPDGMESFVLPAGEYAVFLHKGTTEEFSVSMQYILTTWLPSSGYRLDNRPHFEVLGDKYKNNDPTSEEEIWIPVMAV